MKVRPLEITVAFRKALLGNYIRSQICESIDHGDRSLSGLIFSKAVAELVHQRLYEHWLKTGHLLFGKIRIPGLTSHPVFVVVQGVEGRNVIETKHPHLKILSECFS